MPISFGRFNRVTRGKAIKERLKYYKKKYEKEIEWLIENKNIVYLDNTLKRINTTLLSGKGDFTEPMKNYLNDKINETDHDIDENVNTDDFLKRVEELMKLIENVNSYNNFRFKNSSAYYNYSDYTLKIHKKISKLNKIKKTDIETIDKLEKEYKRRLSMLQKAEYIKKNKKKA